MSLYTINQVAAASVPNAPTGAFNLFLDTDGIWKKKDDAGVVTPVSVDIDTDVLVKASPTDTTAGYVVDKIKSDSGDVGFTLVNSGGNEYYTLDVNAKFFDKTVDDSDDITEGANKLFLTVGERTILSNTSGTNTGDEVEEYANLAALPVTGVVGTIYITEDTNSIYRWTGSVYVELSTVIGGNDPVDSTGIRTGGVLSVGTGGSGVATTFNISAGSAIFVNEIGIKSTLNWTVKTDLALTYLATNLITFVGINASGTVIQQQSSFTTLQSRTIAVIGVVVHVNKTTVDTVNNEQHVSYNVSSQLYDAMESIGFFNVNGNIFSANGANLNINKSLGDMFKMGSNYDTDVNNPHVRTLASLTPVTFQYRFSNGDNGVTGNNIDPDNIDDGAGGLTIVGNSKWSVQRIYVFTSNNVKIQRGVSEYSTSAAAISGIATEPYVTEPSIAANGLFRGWLVVKKGATVLNGSDAVFLSAPKFGEGNAGATGATTTLQTAYQNSIPNPEIITDGTGGAFTVRRGSALDTDLIYEGQNGAGVTTFSVDGNGNIISGTVNGIDIATDVSANTLKVSNVDTNLSFSRTATTLTVISSDGTDAILPEADTTNAGLLGSDKWDEIVANTAKVGFLNLTGDITSVGAATTISAGAVDIAMLSATGTPSATTFLRGDNVWATPAGGGGGTGHVPIGIEGIVTTGAATSGYTIASAVSTNEMVYFIDGAGGTNTKTVYKQFSIPSDYSSGGTIYIDTWRSNIIDTYTATAYIDDTVDSTINAIDISPAGTTVFELISVAFGSTLTGGESISLQIDYSSGNTDDVEIRGIYFEYNK